MSLNMVLGASEKPSRYSNKAMAALQANGHKVVAVGKQRGLAHGINIQTDWPEAGSVDTLTIYLNPFNQKPLYDKILELKPRRIIFNPGSENTFLLEKAEKEGIQCKQACTLVLLSTGDY